MNIIPREIIHIILEYDGRITYRNGKYMNKISDDDVRYEMLRNMPKIIPNQCNGLYITIISPNKIIYIEKHAIWYSFYIDKDIVWCQTKEDPYIITTIDNTVCYYCFGQQDICYKWSIIKITASSIL
jgi:hypothetical protein